MSTKKLVLDFGPAEFHEMSNFVKEALTGDFGVQELEKQVKSLSKTAPFLMNLLAAAGKAQERLDAIKGLPAQGLDNLEVCKEYINCNEGFCTIQGSLVVLLLVSQAIQKQSTPKPRTRKKKP